MIGDCVSVPTLTTVPAEVLALPAASRATADKVCGPLVLVFHVTAHGDDVTSAPRFAPSSLNCTPTTPVSSVAVAATVTEPETAVPAVGLLIETRGGVMSILVPVR